MERGKGKKYKEIKLIRTETKEEERGSGWERNV